MEEVGKRKGGCEVTNGRRNLALVIVVALIAVGLTYAYLNQQVIQPLQESNQALQQALSQAAPTAVTPANIDFLQTGGTEFNFTTEVASDGSVATTTTKTLAIDIVNQDDTNTADLRILTINPVTGDSGIPDGLNNSYFNVFIKDGGVTKYLYTEGKHTDGWSITLGVAEAFSGYVGVTMEQAPANTFTDGQTYTMTLFIYQPNANYVEKVTYTVTT